MEYIDGVYANRIEWDKHNFYPKNEMVGEVVKKTASTYIVKIMNRIYVPMAKKGVQEISFEEYLAGQSNNVCIGMDERQKRINDDLDAFNRERGNAWYQLPNMRDVFKQDIIQNIKKLTCDFERNIFLPDVERSVVMYAADLCLEYRDKSERDLSPMIINDITNQVGDVYMELFQGEFRQSNKSTCMSRVASLVEDPEYARKIIDMYYRAVDERYNWS